MQKVSRPKLDLFLRIGVIVLVGLVTCAFIRLGIIDLPNFYQHQAYKRYTKLLNKDIARGLYHPRLNDEVFVYKTEVGYLEYFDLDGNFFYTNINSDYAKVILINTEARRVFKGYIRKELIKYVHSNWGLTQDIWLLDKQIAELKGNARGSVCDNPLPISVGRPKAK